MVDLTKIPVDNSPVPTSMDDEGYCNMGQATVFAKSVAKSDALKAVFPKVHNLARAYLLARSRNTDARKRLSEAHHELDSRPRPERHEMGG